MFWVGIATSVCLQDAYKPYLGRFQADSEKAERLQDAEDPCFKINLFQADNAPAAYVPTEKRGR